MQHCHISSFLNIEEILPKVLRVEADLSALKSHVKCELSDVMKKMQSVIKTDKTDILNYQTQIEARVLVIITQL